MMLLQTIYEPFSFEIVFSFVMAGAMLVVIIIFIVLAIKLIKALTDWLRRH